MIRDEAKSAIVNSSKVNSTLLSDVSRELYTPLHTILGFAELLGKDSSIGPKQQEHIQSILSCSEHILALLRDSSDLYQIEAGLLPVTEISCNLYEFLEDIEKLFNQQAIDQDLSLLVFWDENVPEFVSVDEGKLRRIVVNLLRSVLNFTELGTVTLHVTTNLPLSNKGNIEAEEGQKFSLTGTVSGTCEQIFESDLDQVFKPFWQGEFGLKTVHTGLDLAIAKGLVEGLGEKLAAESQKEKGIIFRFSVPAKFCGSISKASLPQVAAYPPAPLGSNPLNVLPENLVESMREELKKGNMLRLRELIIQVARIDKQLAYSITELAKQYDYEELNHLFEK